MASTTVYDVLAWGFLAFTLLFTLVLLRLWWEERGSHRKLCSAQSMEPE